MDQEEREFLAALRKRGIRPVTDADPNGEWFIGDLLDEAFFARSTTRGRVRYVVDRLGRC
jgi:hypothetical protein